jgi:hypothetical protein
MDKKCKEGQRWCPIEKKCVPMDDKKQQGKGLGHGKGNGPIGIPKKDIVEGLNQVMEREATLYGVERGYYEAGDRLAKQRKQKRSDKKNRTLGKVYTKKRDPLLLHKKQKQKLNNWNDAEKYFGTSKDSM